MKSIETLVAESLGIAAEQLNDESAPESVREWDSLGLIKVISVIEKEYDIRLTATELTHFTSIGSIRSVLAERGRK